MFEIENSNDRLILLQADFERLKQSPLDISIAEKACSDAWHISDWIYSEMKELNKDLTRDQFRMDLYNECPEMKIFNDLANTFKHKTLTNPKVQIKETRKHGGAFSSGFSKAFNVSRLEVHFEDGSKVDIDDLLQIAIEYWGKKLAKTKGKSAV